MRHQRITQTHEDICGGSNRDNNRTNAGIASDLLRVHVVTEKWTSASAEVMLVSVLLNTAKRTPQDCSFNARTEVSS